MQDPAATPSALEAALERVGDRWSFLVVEALLDGPLRFNDLMSRVPGIAPNVLSQRLRQLRAQRVVASRPYSDRPPRLTYELTADGEELAGVLRLLAGWGGGADEGQALRHHDCGSILSARWYCPTCARAVDDGEATSLRYA